MNIKTFKMMKAESPLDVLSRAASILQEEDEGKSTGELKGLTMGENDETLCREKIKPCRIKRESSIREEEFNEVSMTSLKRKSLLNTKSEPVYESHPVKRYKSSMMFNNRTILPKESSGTEKQQNEQYKQYMLTRDFDERPSVDDHFRKSLGEVYEHLSRNQQNVQDDHSSVDDHFAKALGMNWYKLQYERVVRS